MGNFLSDLGSGVGMFGQALSKTIGDIHNIEALQTQKQQQALQNIQLQNAQMDLTKKQQEIKFQDQELPMSTYIGDLSKTSPKTAEYIKNSLTSVAKENPLKPDDPLINRRDFGLITQQLKQKNDFNTLASQEHYQTVEGELQNLHDQKVKAKTPEEAVALDAQIKAKTNEVSNIATTGKEFIQKQKLAEQTLEAKIEVAKLGAQIKQLIAEGKAENRLEIQEKINDMRKYVSDNHIAGLMAKLAVLENKRGEAPKMPELEKKTFNSLIDSIKKIETDLVLSRMPQNKKFLQEKKLQANEIAQRHGQEVPYPEISTQQTQPTNTSSQVIQTPEGSAVLLPGKISKRGKNIYRLQDGRFWEQ